MPSTIRKMSLEEINEVLVANGFPKQSKRPYTIPTAVDNINAAYSVELKYNDIRSIVVAHAKKYGAESAYAWLVASVGFGSKYMITIEHLLAVVKELKKQGKL